LLVWRAALNNNSGQRLDGRGIEEIDPGQQLGARAEHSLRFG
jgi:hypothetical protein